MADIQPEQRTQSKQAASGSVLRTKGVAHAAVRVSYSVQTFDNEHFEAARFDHNFDREQRWHWHWQQAMTRSQGMASPWIAIGLIVLQRKRVRKWRLLLVRNPGRARPSIQTAEPAPNPYFNPHDCRKPTESTPEKQASTEGVGTAVAAAARRWCE
jgi:hypothetical protein